MSRPVADSLTPCQETVPSGTVGRIELPAEQRSNPLSYDSLLHYSEELVVIIVVMMLGWLFKFRNRD